jgi:hypothetical protein
MEATCTVGITVNMGEQQTCFQLSADLFFNGVRKLHATIGFFQEFPVFFMDKGIKWHGIDDSLFVVIYQVVHTVIQT